MEELESSSGEGTGSGVSKSGIRGAPGSILIVDDDAQLRRVVARMLSKAGHHVVEEANGEEAIRAAHASSFDVVVSDVRMPDMDGVELLRRLQQQEPELSTLLFSGAPDLDTALKAVEFGALEYLVKPIERDKLIASVNKAIAKTRQKREAKQAIELLRSSGRKALSSPVEFVSWTGKLLGGRYRVGLPIGVGGMGSVYEAVCEDGTSETVALKILHTATDSGDALVRFRKEADTIATLDHPNIVRVFDFQTPEGEPPFLVMERLYGVSLASQIAEQGPLDVPDVAYVVSQVLDALAVAHRRHIIHRDLKPENILVSSVSGNEDIVRVLDFGIAKLLDPELDSTQTQSGSVVGTPAYLSPEQARGEGADARSDLYAVGCLMYEALTGRLPYVAENYHALLCAIQEGKPVAIDSLRADLEPALISVVMRAMAKKAEDRFQTAEEMRASLSPWRTDQVLSSKRRLKAGYIAPLCTDLNDPRLRATRREGRGR